MKIQLLLTGKTRFPFLLEGMEEYRKRLVHYVDFQVRELPDLKRSGSWPETKIKEEEGKAILKAIDPGDQFILLDEHGKDMGSIGFAGFLEKQQSGSFRNMIFVVGGAYGFSAEVYARANHQLSLSKMTFSHQLIRLLFMEQLYRAFTIIRREPYHHG